MHKETDISIDMLAKIEGHASLDIKIRDEKVEDVKLRVLENKRFYTQAVRGKPAAAVPQLVSRICGTCSISHLTCATEAIEKALDVVPSEQTVLLRKLAMYGTMIRDHAMHLYLFVLPDMFGKDSLLDFAKENNHLIGECFEIKAAGNALSTWAAGRAIHPAFSKIGGWSVLPKQENVKEVIELLKGCREHALDLAELFGKCTWKFERNSQFIGLITKDYTFLEGMMGGTGGFRLPENEYYHHLQNVIIPYSQATAYEFEGKEYMVGALARMNLNRDALHPDTIRDCSDLLKVFPTGNVFSNNLAQAIEIVHCIDHSVELLEGIKIKDEKAKDFRPRAGIGTGAIEAPRGTLWYGFEINSKGLIDHGHIVIPTAQNQIKLENDIRALVSGMVKQPKAKIICECEKLIRAYDPCMSCASHFLMVRWL
ncbi:MAG: nickel-dependent hydrogenase large subunit [Candidatus Aenigmatarchaeota archaeon]